MLTATSSSFANRLLMQNQWYLPMKHILGLYLKASHFIQTETIVTYLHYSIDITVSQEKEKIKDFFSVLFQTADSKIYTAVTEE